MHLNVAKKEEEKQQKISRCDISRIVLESAFLNLLINVKCLFFPKNVAKMYVLLECLVLWINLI